MKKLLFVILSTALLYACNNNKDSKSGKEAEQTIKVDSTLITDSSWGVINVNTDFASLKKLFGEANVKDETICGPECIDSLDVTIVYPESTREIIVYWDDSAYHKKVTRIETSMPGSPYRTSSGIKIGSTLREVLKANGARISFSGFGWDYGGAVISYGDGKLANSSIHLTLDYKDHPGEEELYGDRELHTDMPAVQNNLDKIVVYTIDQSFHKF